MKSFHKNIELLSILYLGVPLLLFAYGWLRLPYAILIALLLAAMVVVHYKKTPDREITAFRGKRVIVIASVICLALWVIISGSGNLTQQTTDYNKHNALMHDLVTYHWPVGYTNGSSQYPLVYYVGYYLPAAAVGKVVHSEHLAIFALLLWTIAGILLAYYWLIRLCGKPTIALLVIFVLFSGMDIIGHLLLHNHLNTSPIISTGADLEWYSFLSNMQYPSDTSQLFWAPQHAISAWLIGSMLAAAIVEKREWLTGILLFVLSLLWSPLVSIGLIPLVLLQIVLGRRQLKKPLTYVNTLLALVPCLVIGLFFLAGSAKQPLETFLIYAPNHWNLANKLLVLGVFIAMEFGLLSLVMARYIWHQENREWKALFLVSVIFLTVLPIFRYGLYNDLVMRSSAPCLLIIMVLLVRNLNFNFATALKGRDTIMHSLLIGMVALGTITAFVEFNTHLKQPVKDEMNHWGSLSGQGIISDEQVFVRQYHGTYNSIFFKKVARK